MSDFLNVRRIEELCGLKAALMSAAQLTSYKGGGSAWTFVPQTSEQFGRLSELGVKPIGGGSNVILADGICKTPLALTKRLNRVQTEGDLLRAECGARLADVISAGRAQGLGGLEFLTGVPASIGGAIRMNAGAFGNSIGRFVVHVETDKGALDEKALADMFSYRKGVSAVVLSATLRLERIERSESLRIAREYLEFRGAKQPQKPSCGSVFKNGSRPSGRLVEQCGLKGARVGGAEISAVHANFIVNNGGGSAADFLALAELAKARVYENFGVTLEEEFELIE